MTDTLPREDADEAPPAAPEPKLDPAGAYAFGRSVLMEAARTVVQQYGVPVEGETEARAVTKILAVVWADAIRAEWYAQAADKPELDAQLAVARVMMKAEQYDPENDPIVMPVGMQAWTCGIGHKTVVCLDHSMPYAAPLSAIFTGEVIAVDEARAQVLAAETADENEQYVACANRFPICMNMSVAGDMDKVAVKASECACDVARRAVADMEPNTRQDT